MIIKRGYNLMTALWHAAYWRCRFHTFGWKSRLGRCDMLTNPKNISIGQRVQIRKGARLESVGEPSNSPKLVIGDDTAIQFYFHCGAAESIIIGKKVLIAGRVYITDHDHCFDDPDCSPMDNKKLISKSVVIEDECWLGEGCVILKGVTVGRRAVVAANAVVTKDVPPFSVVAGIPAKVIKQFKETQ